MTRTQKMCAGGAIIVTGLLATYTVLFLGNQRLAHAQTCDSLSGLGSCIVFCIVFPALNSLGPPIPHFNQEECPASPPSSTGTLKVVKIVSGGTATSSDFQIHVKVGTTTAEVAESPQPGSPTGTSYIGLAPGDYAVSESGSPENYAAQFSGDCTSSGVATVASSSVPSVCTITNTFHASVRPQCSDGIDNDDDGLVDSADPGCHTDFNAGNSASYNPNLDNEAAVPGGGSGGGGGGSGGGGSAENTLALCSDGIDNNGNGLIDLADPDCASFRPMLLVKKIVDNTDGGTATSSDFTIHVTGTSTPSSFAGSASGTPVVLGIGAFSLNESGGPVGYLMSTSTECQGQMGVGSSTTCTITNTFSTTTADVSLTKTADNATPHPGSSVTYTLSATNNGPNTASNVTVTDLLPSEVTYVSDDASSTGSTYATSTGVWTIGSLANGSSTVLHIMVTINSGTEGQTIANTAAISSDKVDTNGDNNGATTTITPSAPTPPGGGPSTGSGSSSGGGGGGGNGPPVGLFGGGGGGPIASSPSAGGSGGGVGGGGGYIEGGQVLGASTAGVSGACDALISTFMRRNQKNNPAEVKKLQQFLNDTMGTHLPITGFFGTMTEAAVNAFQRKYSADVLAPWGITEPTGYVYITTRKKINEIHCGYAKTFPLTPQQLEEIAHVRSLGAALPSLSTGAQTHAPSRGSGGNSGDHATSATSTLGTGSESATTGPPQGARNYWWLILLAAILVGGGGWAWWRNRGAAVTENRA